MEFPELGFFYSILPYEKIEEMNVNLPVTHIMTKNLVTVLTTDSLQSIGEVFKQHTFHHLPVVQPDGTLAGIISKQDYLATHRMLATESSGKIWAEKKAASTRAENIMTAFPMTIPEDETIATVADIFLKNKFHALPIVDDGQLVGLVTAFDLLKFAFYGEGVKED